MNTFGTCLVIFATLTQVIFHAENGFVVGRSVLTPSSRDVSVSENEPLAVRQLSFNLDSGSGRRPGMFGDANTFGDTSLGILRGTSLLLAETLVNAFSGITTFINMIQNYAQMGSFQLDNLSSSSQVLTSRLLDLGSNAANSVLNMLSNEMSSSAANGAASLSGFNAPIPSGQVIVSEGRPVRPLQIDTGRQSTSTLLPGNGNASGALGISGQSASISSPQPQIGTSSFPAVSGTSNSPGMFGQRVGVANANSGGNTGGTPGWNSVLGWGVPGNGASWSSSGSGNSFGWGTPNNVAGWRGNSNPVGVAGWNGVNGLPGSANVGGVSGSGGVSGVSDSGGWGGVNGVSGSGGSNSMAGWYYPNGMPGWYSPNGMIGWTGGPVGAWGPVGGFSGSAASGGLTGWGGPTIGWRGPLGVGGWGNGASGSSGASSGAFGWRAPGGTIGWNGPAGVSGWGGADSVSGTGSFGGVSGWDSSLGFDTDVSGADLMNDFATYGADSSNTTSTSSPLLQLFETIVSGGFSRPTTENVNSSVLHSSSSGDRNNSTVVGP